MAPTSESCFTGTLFYCNLVSSELAKLLRCYCRTHKRNGTLWLGNHGRGRWRLTCEYGEKAENSLREEEEMKMVVPSVASELEDKDKDASDNEGNFIVALLGLLRREKAG